MLNEAEGQTVTSLRGQEGLRADSCVSELRSSALELSVWHFCSHNSEAALLGVFHRDRLKRE